MKIKTLIASIAVVSILSGSIVWALATGKPALIEKKSREIVSQLDSTDYFAGDYHVIKTCKPVEGESDCIDTDASMDINIVEKRVTLMRHGNITDGQRLLFFDIKNAGVDSDGVFVIEFEPVDGIDGWMIINKSKETGILCTGKHVIKLYFSKQQ